MASPAQFRLDLAKFAKETVPKKAAELQRKIAAEVFTMIVQATPVGNHRKWKDNVERAAKSLPPLPKGYVGGHARKNWQMQIGSPIATVKPGTDSSGQQSQATAYRVAASIKKPARVFIVNPLPYVQRLEEGWSKQAPKGMVKRAVAAIVAKYRRRK